MWGFWLLAGAALATSGVDDWLEAVVLIWQGDRMCAGVWVAPDGRFATAYHCVAGGRRVRVVTRSGTTWQGRVEAVDKGADLAVGRVTARVSVRALAIADASVAVGDEVWALGHPYGLAEPFGFFTSTLRWSASAGRVSAVGPVAVQFDAAVHPGHSGGPVVSARGEVVGVVSRRVGSGGLSFAGTGGRLRQLLAGAPRRPPGGQVELSLVAGALDRGGVTGSLGGRLSVVLEDRLVVAAGVQAPLGRRWQTFRAGQTDAVRGDLRVGLHQRLGYGAWATRVQAWGGVVWIDRLVAGSAQEWARTYAAQPAVGGRVAVRGVGLEVGTVLGEAPALWGAVTLAWPGLVTVF